MPGGQICQPVERARAEVESACQCLLNPAPETLERSLSCLKAAVESLETWRHSPGNSPAPAEAGRLREAVRRAGSLLNTAADYHAQWLRILRARMAGYTSAGVPGEVRCAARISVEG